MGQRRGCWARIFGGLIGISGPAAAANPVNIASARPAIQHVRFLTISTQQWLRGFWLALACVLLLAPFSAVTATPDAVGGYRINAGGGSYTDSRGQVWQADQDFNTGNTFTTTTPIAGTSDPALFQSERYDPAGAPELQYSLPVPNGVYRVNLYFAEIYGGTQSVGARVFDVVVEDTLVFDNLDIFAEVGGATALTKGVEVEVTDGVLDLQFLHEVQNPKVTAIEVVPLSSGTGAN